MTTTKLRDINARSSPWSGFGCKAERLLDKSRGPGPVTTVGGGLVSTTVNALGIVNM